MKEGETMSNDVVISKELRDSILEQFSGGTKWHDKLSVAPEAVSLEGVPRFRIPDVDDDGHPIGTGVLEVVRVSDLRRLVATVQPNAVVSREAISKELERIKRENTDDASWPNLRQRMAMAIEALQLPQPIAPVQSGGVVREFLEWLLDGKCGTVVVAEKAREALAHLATTQSAPSVGSVPTVEELDAMILGEFGTEIVGWDKQEMVVTKSDLLAEFIHDLLLSQGGRESREDRYREAIETTVNDWAVLMDLDMEAELEVLMDNLKEAIAPAKTTEGA